MKIFPALVVALLTLGIGAVPTWAATALDRPAVMSDRASHSLLLGIAQAGNRLIVVGDHGHILLSDDQAQHWTQAKVPVSVMLTAASFPTAAEGRAVGHQGVILHSSDAGASWQLQHSGSGDKAAAPLLDVWFTDAQRGFAVGAYGAFLTTSDGGNTWVDNTAALSNPDGWHLNAIAGVPGTSTLFIVGERGLLFRSQDGGTSWQSLHSPFDGSFFGITAFSGDLVLVYGLQGHLYRSVDNGASWSQVSTPVTSGLNAAALAGDGGIVVAGNGGVLLVSHDQGKSFSQQDMPDRQSITAVHAMGAGLLAVGEAGAKMIEKKN